MKTITLGVVFESGELERRRIDCALLQLNGKEERNEEGCTHHPAAVDLERLHSE